MQENESTPSPMDLGADSAKEPQGPSEAPKLILSQRDYIPTPYKDSQWEVVGERMTELNFIPLELSVLRTERAEPDPMFEQFDVGLPKDLERIWHLSGEQSLRGVEEPEIVVDPVIAEEQLLERYEEGRAAGYEEGKAAAEAVASERFKELSTQLAEISVKLNDQYQSVFTRIEKRALELALEISRRIVTTTAEIRPDYILDVIREGLKNLGAGKPLRIRVSVQDYEFLEVVGLPPELSKEELGVQYIADEAVRSGCVIETDFGEVDLQIESMWDQIKENLFEVYK